MAVEVFNRYEHKYILDKKQYEKITELLKEHMELDSHNKDNTTYTISNIYYDTPDDYLIRTSLSKPDYKEKLRLRTYGVFDSNSMVFLEIKKKFNGIVNKRRTKIKLDEAYKFLESGIPPSPEKYINSQVMRELEYFISIYNC